MPEEPNPHINTSYIVSVADVAYLNRTFRYHAPRGDQPVRYVALRDKAYDLADMILTLCPSSRERSLALTQLETAVMWANASIARNEHEETNPNG